MAVAIPHDNTSNVTLLNTREKETLLDLRASVMLSLLHFRNKKAANNIKNAWVMSIPRNTDLSFNYQIYPDYENPAN